MKVRIAVAIDHTGAWNACGFGGPESRMNDGEKMSLAAEPLESGEARYWVEVELQAPWTPVVWADAVPAT